MPVKQIKNGLTVDEPKNLFSNSIYGPTMIKNSNHEAIVFVNK